MGIWSSIGSALTGGLIKEVGKVIDNLVTTKEEREKLKLELFRIEREYELKEKEHLAKIVELTEPSAEHTPRFINALRASVRPGIAWLSFLTYQGMLTYLTYAGRMPVDAYVAQIGSLATLAIGFYYGSRNGGNGNGKS